MAVCRIAPADPIQADWLFWVDDRAARLRARQQYLDLVCPGCGKLDELGAIERGLPSEFAVKGSRDIVGTADGFLLASVRARKVIEAASMIGCSFRPLLGDDKYQLILPTRFAPTDASRAGVRFIDPRCSVCNRYREVVGGFIPEGMEVPQERYAIFAPEVWSESILGRRQILMATEEAGREIKRAKLRGAVLLDASTFRRF
jgi:hypothetical protein